MLVSCKLVEPYIETDGTWSCVLKIAKMRRLKKQKREHDCGVASRRIRELFGGLVGQNVAQTEINIYIYIYIQT